MTDFEKHPDELERQRGLRKEAFKPVEGRIIGINTENGPLYFEHESRAVQAWPVGRVVRTVTSVSSLTTEQPLTQNRATRRKNGKR